MQIKTLKVLCLTTKGIRKATIKNGRVYTVTGLMELFEHDMDNERSRERFRRSAKKLGRVFAYHLAEFPGKIFRTDRFRVLDCDINNMTVR